MKAPHRCWLFQITIEKLIRDLFVTVTFLKIFKLNLSTNIPYIHLPRNDRFILVKEMAVIVT